MEARHYKVEDGKVRCNLCHQSCLIVEGRSGLCRVRRNVGGTLETLIYGNPSSVNTDPIEKKPLYHFHPATLVLSFGTFGCNFRCDYCQNWDISQTKPPAEMAFISPEEVPEMARTRGAKGIAWTYNEPTIWYEYTYDASVLAKKGGLYTCYVTNGYIQEEALREIAPYLDAMNVDVKAFNEEFYKKLCKARLEPVLRTCEIAHSLGIHLELTYLIIPRWNDDPDEIRSFASWIRDSLSSDIAVHFSRFHGNYRMRDHPSTLLETLDIAHRISKEEGLNFVYLGNVPGSRYENTFCPRCGTLLIRRFGFSTTVEHRKCPRCKYVPPIIW